MTILVVTLLVAGICFVLGQAYEVARCEQRRLEAEQDQQDQAVFEQAKTQTYYDPRISDPRGPRSNVHVLPQPDVDAYFDELCRQGLVEQA